MVDIGLLSEANVKLKMKTHERESGVLLRFGSCLNLDEHGQKCEKAPFLLILANPLITPATTRRTDGRVEAK